MRPMRKPETGETISLNQFSVTELVVRLNAIYQATVLALIPRHFFNILLNVHISVSRVLSLNTPHHSGQTSLFGLLTPAWPSCTHW